MIVEWLLEWKLLIIIVVFIGLGLLEQRFPYARPQYFYMPHNLRFQNIASVWLQMMIARLKGREGRNIGLWLINGFCSAIIILPLSYWASEVSFDGLFKDVLGLDFNVNWRGSEWSFGWFLLFDILLLDLFTYWWHRFNHEIAFLWRFHRVHHMDERLDTTTAVRFHFGEVILSCMARIPVIIVFDLSFVTIIIYETILLISSLFQHSNIRLDEQLEQHLNKLIVTPAWHWMHHHHPRIDTDSHYANLFTIWDRLFKSDPGHKRYAQMPIGLKGFKDKGLKKLLLVPFK
ncbi:MAG: sterol desaturase family protein [Pseudomonadota bacterium]